MRTRAARKYLSRYAAPEASIADAIEGAYDHAIVIPIKAESASFVDGLAAPLAGAGRVLAVTVINAPDSASDHVHRQNEEAAKQLCARGRATRELGPGIRLVESAGALDLLLVDRFRPGRRLSPGQGVGAARKIGCDLVCALRHRGQLRSRWIHTTDADAALPADYFVAASAADPDAAALVYPFWHETSPTDAGDALALYEISLRYYVLGLAAAGSPYAFHTLGSALAADADAYAAVRGVPAREAAEDFYLLGKLAKVGRVAHARASPIRLRERLSDRVPVGTGPAARRILCARAAGEPFRLYDPRVFAVLGHLLRAARAYAETRDRAALEVAPADTAVRDAYARACAAIGAPEALSRAAAATTSPAALARRITGWLDGLRTLKLIHAARDAGLGLVPWREALSSAAFLAGRVDPSDWTPAVRAALAAAEPR